MWRTRHESGMDVLDRNNTEDVVERRDECPAEGKGRDCLIR